MTAFTYWKIGPLSAAALAANAVAVGGLAVLALR
jgi:hypothetical protein